MLTKRVIPGIDDLSEHQTETDERLDDIEKASVALQKAIKKDTQQMFAKMKEEIEEELASVTVSMRTATAQMGEVLRQTMK